MEDEELDAAADAAEVVAEAVEGVSGWDTTNMLPSNRADLAFASLPLLAVEASAISHGGRTVTGSAASSDDQTTHCNAEANTREARSTWKQRDEGGPAD